MKKRFNRICLWAGFALVAAAAIVLLAWQWRIHASQENASQVLSQMRSLLPQQQSAVLEERGDNTMSVLSVNGADFVGILEIPKYGSALPICAEWGDTTDYPCRFSGSVYDRTLQIGATTQSGQYEFYRELSVGDAVYFTDAEGNRFSYEITHIRYTPHADQPTLQEIPSALTLFLQNPYAFEYIIVSCNPPA